MTTVLSVMTTIVIAGRLFVIAGLTNFVIAGLTGNPVIPGFAVTDILQYPTKVLTHEPLSTCYKYLHV